MISGTLLFHAQRQHRTCPKSDGSCHRSPPIGRGSNVSQKTTGLEKKFEEFNLSDVTEHEKDEVATVVAVPSDPAHAPRSTPSHKRSTTHSPPRQLSMRVGSAAARPLPKRPACRKVANDVHGFLERSKDDPRFRNCILCFPVLLIHTPMLL